MGAAHGRARGELNVLMCGDPGTSKSQLLQFVHKIAPRGIYTSGKGSSAVGLTASISKDPETGEHMLESGALVLSDRGVCCIDEFDKMTDATRSILHEVMEQQTVSIAKAGIVCTLNARTSILASANPVESRYNPNKSVVENLTLGPTLLSRFDLIYLVLDQPNESRDRRLAKHLVAMYYEVPKQHDKTDFLDMETLTQYISFARRAVHPVLTDVATDMLVDAYVDMRRIGQNASRKVVTATPRLLESMIRLAEAVARMRLSETVDAEDVQEAQRLISVSSLAAAVDPRTGRIDMDLLATGVGAGDQERMEQQADALRELLEEQGPGKSFNVRNLHRMFNDGAQQGMDLALREFQDLLDKMRNDGIVQLQRKGKSDLVKLANA
jgi:DNA replication licensing factor MCM4